MSAQRELFFAGPSLEPADIERLGFQLLAVRNHMLAHGWQTLREIADAVRAPEASVSARLRDLRKHGFIVERRRAAPHSGLWRYRVVKADA